MSFSWKLLGRGVSCGVVEGGLFVWGEDERSGAEEEGHSVILFVVSFDHRGSGSVSYTRA